MKFVPLALSIFTALASNCSAATITVDGAGNRGLWESISGKELSAGSRISLGYFLGLTNSQIIANQHNTSYLQSKFVAFGLGGAVGDGVGGAAGYFTFESTATISGFRASFTAPGAPNNQIYIWAYNSGSSPTAATQQAIFTSADPGWTWPVSDDVESYRTISPDNNLTLLVGTGDSSAVYLQPMPEPGACALLIMGAVGLLGLRPGGHRK